MMTFGVKAGRAGGERFLDALQLFTRLVNIDDLLADLDRALAAV